MLPHTAHHIAVCRRVNVGHPPSLVDQLPDRRLRSELNVAAFPDRDNLPSRYYSCDRYHYGTRSAAPTHLITSFRTTVVAMHVTVTISTWNRATLLDGTLTSLAQVTIPRGVTWEVIVANNNSTDETEEVLRKHSRRLPLTRLFVPQQGKSYAMNQVVDRLGGDLVLWTDDDVCFSRDWVASYLDAAQRWPHAAFFGGQVIPRFLGHEPDWLRPPGA